MDLVFFLLQSSTLGLSHEVDAPHGLYDKNFGHYALHVSIRVFITKKDFDLLIEDKRRKRDQFATFI